MIHRRDVDGLRAVAVLGLMLSHAKIGGVTGGFVGVDVFFVISGFLITSIIVADLEQDNFSLARFYERRCRRILPALFLVIVFTTPFAWLFLTPPHLEQRTCSGGLRLERLLLAGLRAISVAQAS